jgi:ClpP class serine protease
MGCVILMDIFTDIGSILNNIWILLFVILFIIPFFQRSMTNVARKRILSRISKERKSRVITLIHRQETLAFLNIPLTRYIDIDDSEEILRAIRTTSHDTPIDLIMHTPGGIALAATQIALALKSHPAKKTVIVPHFAMSGGTLIAMAADEILMDPHAVLGPVDPQLADKDGAYSAASLIKVVDMKPMEKIGDRTLVLAEEAKKAQVQMKDLITKLLKGKCGEGNTQLIIDELVMGKYTHDYPIFPEDAKKLFGDCVKAEIPESVYDLMDFYKMEMSSRRPGVEYIPVARPGEEGSK